MSEQTREAGDVVQCPTCGAWAKTLPARKPFVPPIRSIDGEAWAEISRIIKEANEIYDGYPAEQDAINYIYQAFEAAKR